MSRRTGLSCTLTLCAILTGVLAFAATPAAPAIQVNYSNGIVSVRVLEPSDIHAVLDSICDKVQLDCQISAGLSSVVSPSTLQGTVQQLMSQLLDGAKVNYALLLPAKPGDKGTLLVEPSPSSPEGPMPAAAANMSPVPSPAMAVETPPMEQAANPIAMSNGNTPDGSAEASVSSRATPFSEGMAASVADGSSVVLPYPDAQGRLLVMPVNSGAARTLPYPDANGNPIPAPPATGVHYLPYPDANGNLIPMPPPTGTQYMPYPDANGNLVPIRH